MGETHQYNNLHHYQAGAAATSSRVGMRNPVGPGEIVEVQGGHIVRSTGRKDRHSKVCTAKGPRDRRVRLSAHTAIQFYDVQDRLGYDRPSKAVDWLIKKAKTAIDELAELPAWKPTTTASPTTTTVTTKARTPAQHKQQQKDETHNNDKQHEQEGSGGSNEREYNPQMDSFQITLQQHPHPPNPRSGFLPPSLDSDAIADTIKSFFPMGSGGGDSNAAPSLSSFQNYPVPDLLSRTSSSSHNQDLRLSLQSFKEPILGHQHEQNHHHQVLFSGPAAAQYLGYDGFSTSGGGWLEHHHQQHQNPVELGRFQRMVASWSAGGTVADSNGGSGGGGFIFNSIPLMQQPTESVLLPVQAAPQLVQPMLFGQNQLQRGPLQSSHTPSVRAWIDPADQISQIHPAMGFSPGGGFSGFRVPARIQGDEEEDDYIPKPSSASSDSRH